MNMFAALLFGIVAGLRTLTGEAVFFGLRGGLWGILFPIGAVGEYVVDALPQCPPRTFAPAVLFRCVSGAFMGWVVAGIAGAALGVIGAIAGTFGGYKVRLWLIARIGALPAALVEDVIAIALAFAAIKFV